MRIPRRPRSAIVPFCFVLLLQIACTNKKEEARPDHPRLTPKVIMRDVTFHSKALERDMQYRVLLPVAIAAGEKLPVVYCLHGGGEGFRDWSNDSDVAQFAERKLILVMPEADSSYYTNSAERPKDRYEDYIVADLIADVESRFPVASGRRNRAVVGVSMGGFGAVKLALRYPELFAFAGGISPAIDVPRRRFSIKRIKQWQDHSSIFGPVGGNIRLQNDPFVLARIGDPKVMPYLFISCGEQEGLLPANREFAALLEQRHFQYEFHEAPGSHNWYQWNPRLPSLFQSLFEHIKTSS